MIVQLQYILPLLNRHPSVHQPTLYPIAGLCCWYSKWAASFVGAHTRQLAFRWFWWFRANFKGLKWPGLRSILVCPLLDATLTYTPRTTPSDPCTISSILPSLQSPLGCSLSCTVTISPSLTSQVTPPRILCVRWNSHNSSRYTPASSVSKTSPMSWLGGSFYVPVLWQIPCSLDWQGLMDQVGSRSCNPPGDAMELRVLLHPPKRHKLEVGNSTQLQPLSRGWGVRHRSGNSFRWPSE